MRLLFLIPLTTAVITGYLFQKTTQEIAYLSGTIAIISLILSLLIAPWQVQLLILIFAVIIARQGWQKLQETETSEADVNPQQVPTISEEKEISKYRGVNYELSSLTANVTQGESEGKYRGNPLFTHKLAQPFRVHQKSKLKYRGVDISPEPYSSSQTNLENNMTEPTQE